MSSILGTVVGTGRENSIRGGVEAGTEPGRSIKGDHFGVRTRPDCPDGQMGEKWAMPLEMA